MTLKYCKIVWISCFFISSITAQDTLRLSRIDCEAIFLKENLTLISEKLEINKAEAQVIQAKLWPNPTFTLDQVNLWATPSQRQHQEVVPPLVGDFGRNLQFSAELEQLIYTAGKRKKLVAIEQVGVEKSKQYFEDLLRGLKVEFRNQLTNLQYLQLYRKVYVNQVESLNKLIAAYQNQVTQGNVSKSEYIRLKALQMEVFKSINSIDKELHESQKELKNLMKLNPTVVLELNPEGFEKSNENIGFLDVKNLVDQAKESRPDFKLAELEQTYYDKMYAYERAQKTPDVTFKALYDRNGSTMLNFVGFGLSFDLPFFNRNQGNIKMAQIGQEQAKFQFQEKELSVENEVILAFQNINRSFEFLTHIEPNYEKTIDAMLTSYTQNFRLRNISLLEFLDFFDTYLENKQAILEAVKEVNEKAEELNFAVGKDIIN